MDGEEFSVHCHEWQPTVSEGHVAGAVDDALPENLTSGHDLMWLTELGSARYLFGCPSGSDRILTNPKQA